MTSTPRVEPILHGVHLPQDSMAQNSMANRACAGHVGRVVEHDDAAMADHCADLDECLVIHGRIELVRRNVGAERAADLDGFDRIAPTRCRRPSPR